MTWDADPVFIDFESQSAADIKAVGGRLYANDPTTRVLSLALDIDGSYFVWLPLLPANWWDDSEPARLVCARYGLSNLTILSGPTLPAALLAGLRGRVLCAHNAANFDLHVWRRFVGTDHEWADTLYLARAAGYPAGLDRLATAVLEEGKDSAKKIVQALWKVKETPTGVSYPPLLPGMVEPLVRYNLVDVLLLRKLWSGPLADAVVERDLIDAHCAVNERGIGIDSGLVTTLHRIANHSAGAAAERLSELTGGAIHSGNYRSVRQVQAWLKSKGVVIYDPASVGTGRPKQTLRKDAVQQALDRPETMLTEECPVGLAATEVIDPAVFEVLKVRAAAVRITAGKMARATARTSPDGRVRDLFAYHQAHTGRWSSTGIQVHNLPRAKKGVPTGALLAAHVAGRLDYATVADLCGGPGGVDDGLSALIRPAFVPRPGHAFVIADYASVEARCLAWMAGESGLLATFAAGGDVYCAFASQLFGRPITAADKVERQLGKTAVLGLGYSMGAEKFALVCAKDGVDLKAAGLTPEGVVETYRATYPAIAGSYAGVIKGSSKLYRRGGLWGDLMAAALAAVRGEGPQAAGRCRFRADGGTLYAALPSGRTLCYRRARIEDRVPGYVYALGLPERTKATLVYEHPVTREKSLFPGALAENLDQAICRDLEAVAIVRCEREGLPVVAHTHDEIVCEVPEAQVEAAVRRLAAVMSAPPPWAAGLPVEVEAHAAPRYLKSAPAGWPVAKARNGEVT